MQKTLSILALALSLGVCSSPALALSNTCPTAVVKPTLLGTMNPYTCGGVFTTQTATVVNANDPLTGKKGKFIDAVVNEEGHCPTHCFNASAGGFWQNINKKFNNNTTVSFIWNQKGADGPDNILIQLYGQAGALVQIPASAMANVDLGKGYTQSTIDKSLEQAFAITSGSADITTLTQITFGVLDNNGGDPLGAEFLLGEFRVNENKTFSPDISTTPFAGTCPFLNLNPPELP